MLVGPEISEIYRRLKCKEQLGDFFALEEYQKEFYHSTAGTQIAQGGNRCGKTEIAAKKIVDIMTHRHPTIFRPGPQRVRVIGNVMKESVKQVIVEKLRMFLPLQYLAGKSFEDAWNKQDGLIRLKDGGIIQLMSNEQDVRAHRGEALDIVWNDEQGPRNIFDENRARLGDKRGLHLITLTPEEGSTYIHREYCTRARKGSSIELFYFNTLKNPHIDRIYQIQQLAPLKIANEQKFRIKLFGDVVNLEGAVFPEFIHRVHVINPFMLEGNWQLFMGVDFGLNNPSAIIFWVINEKNEIFQVDEIYRSGKTVTEIGEMAKELYERKYKKIPLRYVVVDPNSGAQRSKQTKIKTMKKFRDAFKYGPVFMGKRGTGVLEEGIDALHDLLMPNQEQNWARLRIFRSCFQTVKEYEDYCFAERRDSELNNQSKPKDANNHAIDASRYIAERYPKYAVIAQPQVIRQAQYDRGGIL